MVMTITVLILLRILHRPLGRIERLDPRPQRPEISFCVRTSRLGCFITPGYGSDSVHLL